MNEYVPLHVRVFAFNAIATDSALPLDSILAHVWMREHHPDLLYNDSVAARDSLVEAGLPLLCIDRGHGWYYACSFAVTEWLAEDVAYWHKCSDDLALTRYLGRGRINLAQGPTKSYRMPLFVRACEWLHWYLVGDRAWIEARLPLITTIGKKRNLGHGVVCDWQVDETIEDYSTWGPNGELMRAIPVEDVPPGCTAEFEIRESYAIRPPGWYPGNWARVAMPRLSA